MLMWKITVVVGVILNMLVNVIMLIKFSLDLRSIRLQHKKELTQCLRTVLEAYENSYQQIIQLAENANKT